jgi:Uri superfamily endonuclease
VTDSGNGRRKTIQRVFEPGFTTKKKSWGLDYLEKNCGRIPQRIYKSIPF